MVYCMFCTTSNQKSRLCKTSVFQIGVVRKQTMVKAAPFFQAHEIYNKSPGPTCASSCKVHPGGVRMHHRWFQSTQNRSHRPMAE